MNQKLTNFPELLLFLFLSGASKRVRYFNIFLKRPLANQLWHVTLGVPLLRGDLVSFDCFVDYVVGLMARRGKLDDLALDDRPRRLGRLSCHSLPPPDLAVAVDVERDEIGGTEGKRSLVVVSHLFYYQMKEMIFTESV